MKCTTMGAYGRALGKLANISGKEAVKAFQKSGWQPRGQVGSDRGCGSWICWRKHRTYCSRSSTYSPRTEAAKQSQELSEDEEVQRETFPAQCCQGRSNRIGYRYWNASSTHCEWPLLALNLFNSPPPPPPPAPPSSPGGGTSRIVGCQTLDGQPCS
jgi:hypothetical protein